MRYIDQTVVGQKLPDGWEEKAEQAVNAVVNAQPQQRAAEVSARSQVWKEVKHALKQASHNKCWYCESIDARSDNAVDHFRPKNAVAECSEHGGYWWLAFEWKNYRFCCTYCNCRRIEQTTGDGGGKADHFPVRDEARRARVPADNLMNEEPMLLDPAVPADPGLLWFEETGQAVPSPVCGQDQNSYPHRRATKSIDLYHLNHGDVRDQRKALCAEIRRRVEQADRYFERYDAGDGTARQAFDDAIRDLRVRLAPASPYSATARAMMMGLRGTHTVVDVILASA